MSDELLPCPFCGSSAATWEDTSSDYRNNWTWCVSCCNERCGGRSLDFKEKQDAIDQWNKRPSTEPESLETNMLAIAPDVYLVNWNESQETTYVIAVVKTLEDAHKVIREHVQQLPTYHRRVFYDIEPWDIGEVKSYL